MRHPAVPASLCTLLALMVLSRPAAAAPSSGGCPGAQGFVLNHDDTFEAGHAWSPEGITLPAHGAYAEQMMVTGGVIEMAVRLLPRFEFAGTQTLTFYVWEDDGGQPGASLASLEVSVDLMPPHPPVVTVMAPIVAPITDQPWVGVRLESVGPKGPALGLAADLDGVADGSPPMTNVEPSLPLPDGWTDVGLVFGPTASLGIEARMCAIEFYGDTFEWVGSGDDGPVSRAGDWDFEHYLPEEYDAESCAYSWPDTFGSVVDAGGWVPSPGSDLVAGVGTIQDDDGFMIASAVASDVEGQVLWFYDPVTEGFPPGHLGLYESSLIDDALLGLDPGSTAFHFLADTEAGATSDVEQLRWIVGSRAQRWDGSWTPWRDLTFPMELGPSAYLVPLVSRGSVQQIRWGAENPTGIQFQQKGAAADKAKAKKKKNEAAAPETGTKYVPQFRQGKEYKCQTMAAASCLAYWAANGYPEILPAGKDLRAKHKALADSLQKIIEPEPKGKNKGSGGIAEYLKRKKILSPQVPPGDPPPRRPLKVEKIQTGSGAPYDSIKFHLARGHDVLLGFKPKKIVNGVAVPCSNSANQEIAHQVTGAEVQEKGGKKVIKAANSHGNDADEVTEKTKDSTYDSFEVEVQPDGTVRLRNKKLEEKWKADYLELTEIQIVRPVPKNAESRPRAAPEDLAQRAGGDTLQLHGYAIGGDNGKPISYFAVELDVPYYQVESPPGWTWEPLPSIPPGGTSCETAFGPAGIAWRTSTHPVAPGAVLSGFRFKAHERYSSVPEAVDWFTAAPDGWGEYGFVSGPALSEGASSVGDGPGGAGAASPRWAPNPARGEVTLQFTAGTAGSAVRVSVFDAAGRLVRSLSATDVRPGRNEIRWDRRDSQGRRVPSGVYFSRAELEGRRSQTRLVLLDPE